MAAEGYVPPFLDPLLDYLSSSLPPTLYSFLINVLSHSFAAVTAVVRLSASLFSQDPTRWNAESLLPPIITILAAYLALASLYRTATWAFRTTFFFVKWGSLIGTIMAIAGYFAGQAGNAVDNQGGGGVLGDILTSLMNGGTQTQRTRPRRSPRKTKAKSKPKPWDSFQSQQEWQYQQEQDRQGENPQAKEIMDNIVNVAGRVLEGDWWGAVRNLGRDGTEAEDDGRGSTERVKKTARAGKTRSR